MWGLQYTKPTKKGFMLTKMVIPALASVGRSISTPVTMTIKPVPKVISLICHNLSILLPRAFTCIAHLQAEIPM